MARFTIGVGLVLAAVATTGREPPQVPPPRLIPISDLVRLLGSDDPQESEAATKRLSALTIDPPPELIAATKSDHVEVRMRASRAVDAIRHTRVEALLTRGRRFAAQGKIDLFVAATSVWNLPADDPRLWEPVHAVGRRLFLSEMNRERRPHNCPSSFPDYDFYLRNLGPVFVRTEQKYVQPDPREETPPVYYRNRSIQAASVLAPTTMSGGLIVSRGDIETSGLFTSVVLSNGTITAPGGIFDTIIVCDGDVIISKRHFGKVIVVARGNITAEGGAYTSFLVAGGKVTKGRRFQESGHLVNEIKEGTAGALGVTFFELADVGVESKATGATVTVTAVVERKAFAKAGVRAGDVIAFVNGKTPISVESFRRMLRDALAIGDATLTLRRGDVTLTVTVALPD